MADKSRSCLLAGIAMCVLPVVLGLGTRYPEIIHGDMPCGNTWHINLNALFTYIRVINADFDECNATFESKVSTSLIAKFIVYDIHEEQGNEDGHCWVESIQLFNASGFPLLGPGIEYCSSTMPDSIYFLGSRGKFVRVIRSHRFHWVNPVLVNLLLTEVMARSKITGSCPVGSFDCENDYCITKEMICNGYDNCGNNLDEDNQCGTIYYVILAVLFSCVLFFSVVCVISCLEHKKQAYRENA